MPTPTLFGRRMKRWAFAATRGYELEMWPFVFRLVEFKGRPRFPYRALFTVMGVMHEHKECSTQASALTALAAMRNRLVRQLQDKA